MCGVALLRSFVSIATKTGDKGSTGLMYNRRVSKCHPRVESYGAVDELTAALGLARAFAPQEGPRDPIHEIQTVLIALMGELATAIEDHARYLSDGYPSLSADQTAKLETWVAQAEGAVGTLKGWAIPGKTPFSATLDLARTACRHAERRVCVLMEQNELPNKEIVVYLNRLSDLLWLWARCAEK